MAVTPTLQAKIRPAGRKGPRRPLVALESQEQKALFEWANLESRRIRELNLLFAIPNQTARKIVGEGVKAGVPDIMLPVARGGFHGLFIEMKRLTGGTVSTDQQWWRAVLREQGYYAEICFGWDQTREEILNYLEVK